MFTKKRFLTCIILAMACSSLYGQSSPGKQHLFLDDWSNVLVDYWINNGALEHNHVLNQPYALSEIRRGLKIDDDWTRYVLQHFEQSYGQSGSAKLILYGRDNLSVVSNRDLPIRPGLSAAPVEDVRLFDSARRQHYNFTAQFNLALPHLALVNRTAINSEFKDDPKYFGDTGEWIFGRQEDAYINVNFDRFDLFLGRTDRNWGSPSSPSLILSDNPYSYDHAQLSYTAKRIKLSMLVARLEDTQGRDFQSAFPDSLVDANRFLSAHRLDVSLSPRFQIAFTEAVMYGGPERSVEFGLLNPASYFYLVQRNDGEELNGIWALDLFYKPAPRWNLAVQFLIDDFILNNDEPDERDQSPDRLGIHLKVSQADAWLNGLQTGVEYTRIGNRTYQSFRTWENMQVREKGLGYPSASIERVSMFANYFGLFPAIVRLNASYQRSGDVQLTDVFTGDKDPKFPVGVVEQVWQADARVRYMLNPWSHLTARLGIERFQSYRHISGTDRTIVTLVLGVHVNFSLSMKLVGEKVR